MQPIDTERVTSDAETPVAAGVAADLESLDKGPTSDSHVEGSAPVPWPVAIQRLSGALRLHGVRPLEVAAVEEWIMATEDALEEPVTPGDRATLGSLARCKVLELRAARRLLERGMLTRNGDVKALSAEFRGYVRLGIDLQSRLHFRRGKRPPQDLSAYLRSRTASQGVPCTSEAGTLSIDGADVVTGRESSDTGFPDEVTP